MLGQFAGERSRAQAGYAVFVLQGIEQPSRGNEIVSHTAHHAKLVKCWRGLHSWKSKDGEPPYHWSFPVRSNMSRSVACVA